MATKLKFRVPMIVTADGRLEIAKAKVCEIFTDYWPGLAHAVATGQTLLIEGGGERPQPAAFLGRDAYLEWRELRTLG